MGASMDSLSNSSFFSRIGLKPQKTRRQVQTGILFAVLLMVGIFMLLPFLWMLSTSFKTDKSIFEYPIQWIPKHFYWNNYFEVWTEVPFGLYYLNTIKVSLLITAGQLLFCSMAAYAFARLRFPLKNFLFMAFITTLMIPWQSIMIPQFMIVQSFGLYDTHTGYILIQLFSAFGIFLLRQFFMGIPGELSEAARIDGSSDWGIYWRIILPLSLPGLSTLAIFTFTYMWNDYLAPLIFLNSDRLKTLQLGLQSFQTAHSMDYGVIMAGTVCALLPMIIIFLVGESYFTKGITFTGMKN
jgi:multiple sugar transport system permease protein